MQNPAQNLILEYLFPELDARILILEGEDGGLAQEVARRVPEGEVLSLTRDVRHFWAAESRLETASNASASSDVFPTSSDWDLILLTIPKERSFARTLLLAA